MVLKAGNQARNTISDIANDPAILLNLGNLGPGQYVLSLSPEVRKILQNLKPEDMNDLRPVQDFKEKSSKNKENHE